MRYVDKTWEDAINTRTIEIGDVDEEFKEERMVENLRWVGMSSEDLEKVQCLFVQVSLLHEFN